jgi:anti-sigma B factor antagonist
MSDATRMTVSTEGDVTVVELTDRKILDEVSIMQIGEQINVLLAGHDAPKLVIDFVNVGHLSSSALGLLITLRKRIIEKKGQLSLCNIQPQIFEVFAITRLNETFSITDSRDDAVQAVQA